MEISAIYSVLKGGEVRAAPVTINGTDISFRAEPVVHEYSVDELSERMPLVVVDVKGLGKENLDDKLLSKIKFRGSDVWFLTHIYNVEDVFDCFMGDIAKAMVPYHTTRTDYVMVEIHDVSENCIPVLFVVKGRVACRGGNTKDIRTSVDEIARIGFREIAVFDTDSSLMNEDWVSLKDRFRNIIPFVRSKESGIREIGFEMIISDYL
ncbi:hypothetical protein Mpt1_c02730 [Candidatus Methanoplasma termitum]|uniref:Uncharacterized protein n=1 Tax=Candidatus Methanoplasma termitum TaxID=1577791 RepID=A0A0A7LB02_9ARCH|nr:hypothetical protein [Candidatus Methanoplasma termitum]AIZ56173.1 hypothetical protein Mpt1_c02730 [Candidatus Methanoplasma termitum]